MHEPREAELKIGKTTLTWNYIGEEGSHVLTISHAMKNGAPTMHIAMDGHERYFTGHEKKMLVLLVAERGHAVSKDLFLTHLYGDIKQPDLKIIDVFLCKIRKAIDDRKARLIQTVWGRGYSLLSAEGEAVQPALPAFEERTGRRPWIRDPWGGKITLQDLPKPGTTDGVARRKSHVVLAVLGGMITLNEALAYYEIPEREYRTWEAQLTRFGQSGLRATRIQQYA